MPQGVFLYGDNLWPRVKTKSADYSEHVTATLPFLLRDAIHNRGLCLRAVSVCPSRSCVVSKRQRIRPKLLWNANRKPYSRFRMVPFSTTLSDLRWLSEIFNRAASLQQLTLSAAPLTLPRRHIYDM